MKFSVSNIVKINLKNRIIIMIIGFLTLFALILFFIVIPTIHDILDMGQKIEEQRIDLEKKYIKGQNLRQLTTNLNKINSQLSKLEQIFISENRELEFITTLEGVANKNSVNQKINLGVQEDMPGYDYKKMTLQLLLQGNFTNIMNYLIGLESLEYYVNVKNIELTIGSLKQTLDTPQGAVINMFLLTETFWK